MGPLKVLIVDDELDLATLTKMRLSKEAPHFYITVLKSGRDCLNYLQDHHVDCILSDYQMPEMNGMQLLKSLRSKHNDVPFIFVTGQGNEAVAREAFKNGADDYFTKDIQEFAYYAKIINSVEQSVKLRSSEKFKRDAELALYHEKNKLEAILENIGEGISIQDKDLRVLYQNKAHRNLIGSHIGEYCYRAFERLDEACKDCPVIKSFEDCRVHTMQRSTVSETGTLHIEVTASPLMDQDGEIIAGIEVVRDVTEHKRADERVARLNRLYSVITGIDNVIIRAPNTEYLFSKVCDTAVDRGSFHMAWIGITGEGRQVKPVAYAGCEDGYLKDIKISVDDVPEGRGPVGTAIRTGAHFICNDIANDERMGLWRGDGHESRIPLECRVPVERGQQSGRCPCCLLHRAGFLRQGRDGLAGLSCRQYLICLAVLTSGVIRHRVVQAYIDCRCRNCRDPVPLLAFRVYAPHVRCGFRLRHTGGQRHRLPSVRPGMGACRGEDGDICSYAHGPTCRLYGCIYHFFHICVRDDELCQGQPVHAGLFKCCGELRTGFRRDSVRGMDCQGPVIMACKKGMT